MSLTDPFPPLLPAAARRIDDDPHGPQYDWPAPALPALAGGVWCPLPDYGLLAVSGDDREAFLQAQLTNDVTSQGPTVARWNGYCSPKGRLMSVFLTWHESSAVLLTVARPQAEPLRKRLSMFVLRSKALVTDLSAERAAVGLVAADPGPALDRLGIGLPAAPMAVGTADGIVALRLAPVLSPAGGTLERVMVWMPVADVASRIGRWSGAASPLAAPTATWRWAEVRSAVPRVFPVTAEHFVPQMVNFELVGGVSFDKGCYPGQEVVARSQYLGKLKRRMYTGRGSVALAPGAELLSATGQVCGEIVMSAPSPAGGHECLFECTADAFDAGGLQAGGHPVALGALPYPIPDATPVRRSI